MLRIGLLVFQSFLVYYQYLMDSEMFHIQKSDLKSIGLIIVCSKVCMYKMSGERIVGSL